VGLTVVEDQKRAERCRCDVPLDLVSGTSGTFRTVSEDVFSEVRIQHRA
jgi:hypothetical protein